MAKNPAFRERPVQTKVPGIPRGGILEQGKFTGGFPGATGSHRPQEAPAETTAGDFRACPNPPKANAAEYLEDVENHGTCRRSRIPGLAPAGFHTAPSRRFQPRVFRASRTLGTEELLNNPWRAPQPCNPSETFDHAQGEKSPARSNTQTKPRQRHENSRPDLAGQLGQRPGSQPPRGKARASDGNARACPGGLRHGKRPAGRRPGAHAGVWTVRKRARLPPSRPLGWVSPPKELAPARRGTTFGRRTFPAPWPRLRPPVRSGGRTRALAAMHPPRIPFACRRSGVVAGVRAAGTARPACRGSAIGVAVRQRTGAAPAYSRAFAARIRTPPRSVRDIDSVRLPVRTTGPRARAYRAALRTSSVVPSSRPSASHSRTKLSRPAASRITSTSTPRNSGAVRSPAQNTPKAMRRATKEKPYRTRSVCRWLKPSPNSL